MLLLTGVVFCLATASEFARGAPDAGRDRGLASALPGAPKAEPPIQVVVWGAKWCKVCVRNKPKLERLSKSGKYVIIDIDIDKHRDYARKRGITKLPSYYVVKDGLIVFKTHSLKALKSYTPEEYHGKTLD